MISVFFIVILVASISVALHPFPHLISWERLLTYYIYNDPIIHAAIPNGSRMERWGCCIKARPPPKQKGLRPLNRRNGKCKISKNRYISAEIFTKCFP
jgi:hypothetical protein